MAQQKKDTYRIGDYARYMGVSTDLLKHYERCGLIEPQTAENGYRYYRFPQSTRLLECMRLRNYGFSLSEMQTVLGDLPYEGVMERLDSRIDEMEAQIRFQQQVVAEHRKTAEWMEKMRSRELLCETAPVGTMLFLPQSRHLEFIDDARISAILESWVAAMPMVKSCRLFDDVLAGDAIEQAMWGLCVTEESAEALGLPVNDVVRRIECGNSLQVHMHYTMHYNRTNPHYFPHIQELLRSRGVLPGTPALQFMLMTLECQAASHQNCGVFCVPAGG